MAKSFPKGSILDRWDSEVDEQFTTTDADPETLKEIEELNKRLANKRIREFVNDKKK